MSTLDAVEQRLQGIAAFFRLPYAPYDPQEALRQEGEGTWLRLSFYAWLMMYASLVATGTLIPHWPLIIFMALLLAAAAHISYRLHFRSGARLLVNWLTFALALLLAPFFLGHFWPLREGIIESENVQFIGFLVLCFMWITAFRAFALRTVRDLVETILPCGSIILLALVVAPTPLVLGSLALTVMCVLALLTAEQRIMQQSAYLPVKHLKQSRRSRRGGFLYSWPVLYILVLLVAVFVAWAAAHTELSGSWADNLRFRLAMKIARWLMPRESAVLPDPAIRVATLDSWPDSDRVVFTVRTKQPGNYRLIVYHTYTGSWWLADRRYNRLAVRGQGGWQIPMNESGASRQGAARIEQLFTVHRALMGTIPSLFCPVRVEGIRDRVRYDRDHILHISRHVRPGDTFTVISYTQPLVPLKRPDISMDPKKLQDDLQLPAFLPARVREYAQRITAQATTPYEKVHALELELMWNYTYAPSVPRAWNQDFVDYFLFTTKRGFCLHFASAMVVLCRCIGMPARLVSGFLPGEEAREDPDFYTVREKDAHAWAEVYFPGAGWIAFDPTPPAREEPNRLAKAWQEIVATTKTVPRQLKEYMRHYWLSVALAGMALLGLWLAWRWERRQQIRQLWRGAEPLSRIVRAYLGLRKLLHHYGLAENPSRTPREILSQLPSAVKPLQEEITALTESYLKARYGRLPASQTEAQAAEQIWRLIQQRMRRRA